MPRDKTCGDGLTPRAMKELELLGLTEQVTAKTRNRGLKLHGFGASVTAPWPAGRFPQFGSAVARRDFDHLLAQHAAKAGAEVFDGCTVAKVSRGAGTSVSQLEVAYSDTGRKHSKTISAKYFLVADGVRSVVGKQLGRKWHRSEVFGVAARSYCTTASTSPEHTEWIHSHLELRDDTNTIQPGYGWIFPLGAGEVNLGCGALATKQRPVKINTKKLLRTYAAHVNQDRAPAPEANLHWQLGEPRNITSALLPMGGAVSHVAGDNWMLLGDAACLVNPLNGEGIDYGMESARLAVQLLENRQSATLQSASDGFTYVWPETLREHFGTGFSLARRLARLLTIPGFLATTGPWTMGAKWGEPMMGMAARLMGNLVTEHDHDAVARLWRAAGYTSLAYDGLRDRQPWS